MTEQTSWHWYLVESWGGMMLTAKAEIVGRGVEFLLPMTWRRAKVDGRDQPFATTRLPGNYAFVRLSSTSDDTHLNDQAAALLTLRGVRTIYKNAAGHYAPVRKGEIQALRTAEAKEHLEAGKAKPKFTEARFKPGSKVRILRHPTAEGHVGEFLYTVNGVATLAMPGGVKFCIPECDLGEADRQATRMAG